MSLLWAVLGLVALERGAELLFAGANTRRLRRLGASEADAAGYPLFVVLHAGWLASLALLVPPATPPSWPLLGLFALLQAGRLWVIASLGRRWTVRVLVLPDTPPLRIGPYRWLRHPNYLIVAGEIALLPLAFAAPGIALGFSAANLVLIARRIRIEEAALAPGRHGSCELSHSGRPAPRRPV